MAELLCEDGIEVKGVTTDPDSSAGRAADSLFKDGLYKVKPVHYLDTRHLSESIRKSHSSENENLLRACISKRLSPAVLDKTIKNSNSQKVESFNRTLRRSLPRNVTFTRNFAGRAHSAAHSSNNGPGDSIRSLCAGVGCAIPSGGSVDKSLLLCVKHESWICRDMYAVLIRVRGSLPRQSYDESGPTVKSRMNKLLFDVSYI